MSATMLGRPLPRPERTLNVSSFAFLFGELVSYYRERVTNLGDLETKLNNAGFNVGARFLELISLRDKPDMIREAEPLTSAFMSMSKDMSRFNPGAYIAGIIRGMLETAGFPTVRVQAITEPGEGPRDKTVFVIQFDESVAIREAGSS